MEEKNVQSQIDEMNKKLDFIIEEIELQRKHRQEIEDLKDDLMRVGKDVYSTTVEELEGVADNLKTGDIVHLGKKLLINVNNITRMFEQLESLNDLVKDFGPISRELSIDMMAKLDEFDRKGYFGFAKELGQALDNIVDSFSVEDAKALSDNIVTILNTVKNLTQPDMLNSVNNAVNVYKYLDMEIEDDISLLQLLKEMKSPETKRAVTFGLRFLKKLSASTIQNKVITNSN